MLKKFKLKRIYKILPLFIIYPALALQAFSSPKAGVQSKVSISFSDEKLSEALLQFSKVLNEPIAYDGRELGVDNYAVKAKAFSGVTAKEVLDYLVQGTKITYEENSYGIVLKSKKIFQKGKVTGVVLDDKGETLPGATIKVVETGDMVAAKNDGTFSFDLEPGTYTLMVSFTSFQTETVSKVVVSESETTRLKIQLKSAETKLNEVVVTALGIKREEKKLGYAQQTVKAEDLSKAPDPNPLTQLTGKIAGLSVYNNNEMLQAPTYNLRGAQPVIVLDGVPVETNFYDIKPDDIESITVLKGTTASALYGSRGKDGAIMITTKRGALGKKSVEVELNTSNMFQVGFLTLPKVQTDYGTGDNGIYTYTADWNSPYDDAGGGAGSWGPRLNAGLKEVQWDSPIDPATGQKIATPWVARGKNNLENFVQTGLVSNTSLSISKTFDSGSIRFSVSDMYQRGQIPNTELNNTGFSIASNVNFSSRLHTDAYLDFNDQYSPNYPFAGYGRKNSVYNILIWEGADTDIRDFKNYWKPGEEGYIQNWYNYTEYNNPYFVANEFLREHNKQTINGHFSMTYDISPSFSIMGRVAANSSNRFGSLDVPFSFLEYQGNSYSFGLNGGYQTENENILDFNSDILATYNKKFSKNFSVHAVAGANIRYYEDREQGLKADGLNVPGVYTFANAANPLIVPQNDVEYDGIAPNFLHKKQVNSFYAAADFTFFRGYNLSVTGRRDESSALAIAHNQYFYPSAALSVVLSDLMTLPKFISYAKLRASVAQVSNDLGIYQIAQAYNSGVVWNGNTSVTVPTNLNNPDINPAKSTTQEYGTEVYFLNGRLRLDATYFHILDQNQIIQLPNSLAAGYSSHTENANEYVRQGGEVTLGATPVKTTNFSWTTTINWSTYRQTIKALDPVLNGNYNGIKVGQRTDEILGGAFAYTPQGQLIVNSSGDPTRNPTNVVRGYSNPDWSGGWSNSFQYKGVTLRIDIDGRVGGTIYSQTKEKMVDAGVDPITDNVYQRTQFNLGNASWVLDGVVYNPATKTYSPNTTPITYYDYIDDYYSSSRSPYNWFSGTFAKVREVSLTFRLPKTLFGQAFLNNATFSIVGKNLLIISPSGLKNYADPDAGVDNLATPGPRNLGFNLNIKF